jgi:4-hydroxymandelate oxidase
MQPDRAFMRDLVQEAEGAGVRALCVTVDQAVPGVRNRQQRSGFKLPSGVTTPYLSGNRAWQGRPVTGNAFPVGPKDIEWLLTAARVPVLLKGILHPDDADIAVRGGVAGIIVSNHGARVLDAAVPTIDALPRVAEKVAGRVPVLMDGGIRRGTDVLKAIALGARAVLIGRPYLYGLGAAGEEGVTRVITILRQEFEMAMALTGRSTIPSIDRSVIWPSA